MMSRLLVSALLATSILCACSGGNSVIGEEGTDTTTGCTGNCADAVAGLTTAEVGTVISQAVAEAQARGANATIAVIDRVGNVLGVYRMGNAANRPTTLVTRSDAAGAAEVSGGLEGITLPYTSPAAITSNLFIDAPAAIAKAITATYFSTEGSAISTRTASQLVQEHFNPGEANTPGGPLFGVPFSNLACSELTTSGSGATTPGPHRSPLGYAGDPGGFPLYKGGTVVGGIGVLADGRYSIDTSIGEEDENLDDEAIAVAGTFGFGAPLAKRADRLGLDGKTGRYSDVEYRDLESTPASAPAFAAIPPATGALIAVQGYSAGTLIAGTAFGTPASGIRPGTEGNFPSLGAYVIVDGANTNRYPASAGQPLPGSVQLTATEVQQLLESGLAVANRTRSAIRFPYGSKATMSVVVVDHLGKILGIARTRDATIEGAGVALQKTRNAAFFASADAAGFFNLLLPPAQYIKTTTGLALSATASPLPTYITNAQSFFANPSLFADGQIAWTSRAINNITHPNYPDGIAGAPAGPFSKPETNPASPTEKWSVFNPGLPLDISLNSILQHLLYIASSGVVPDVTANSCAGTSFNPATLAFNNAVPAGQRTRLGDGIVLKPGGFPIYRNGVLVGAFGAAGDGTEQDDIVGFLGLYEGTQALAATEGGNAPGHAEFARRPDQLTTGPGGVRPRYVVCPQAPFVGSSVEGACRGK